MVIATTKANDMQFHKPQSIVTRDWASAHIGIADNLNKKRNIYFKGTKLLGPIIKTKTAFTTGSMTEGRFVVAEIKKGVGRVGARQISPYLRISVTAGVHYIPSPEIYIHQRGVFVHEGVETLPGLIKVARPIEIKYSNQTLVETLLGSQGKPLLEKVLSLVKRSAAQLDWPLTGVEIRYIRDPEVKGWEYVLLLLVFTCDFDTADRHLHELYDQIDTLTGKLSDEEQEVLRRVIFFDIKTRASIPIT